MQTAGSTRRERYSDDYMQCRERVGNMPADQTENIQATDDIYSILRKENLTNRIQSEENHKYSSKIP